MYTRSARSRLEVDFLPPFGKPEVISVGPSARALAPVAVLGAILVALLYYRE